MQFTGTLTIETKTNRKNGTTFNVGSLKTEVGTFNVKDAMLEQFEPGRYEGSFEVVDLFMAAYFWRGSSVSELRAKITKISLNNIEPEPEAVVVIPQEAPDPLDEENGAKVEVTATPVAAELPSISTECEQPAGQDTDAALFSDLLPLGEAVKLDPTVDRGLFRAQTTRLKKLGYKFQSVGQIWRRGA